MTVRSVFLVLILVALGSAAVPAAGKSTKHNAAEGAWPNLATKTKGMQLREGFLRLHADEAQGKIWLEVPPPSAAGGVAVELLYADGLATGLGSNPVGLDRGQLGETRWVVLRRIGPRVLLEQRNPAFRATSDHAAERRAADESFATSVLWAAEIAALEPDGRSLVDFTSFVVRDAHGSASRLAGAGQGTFELDTDRSALDLDRCLVFPDNIELEALLTFAGMEPGSEVRGTAPDPKSVTMVQHHSLIRLPDDGYTPRRFDPRAGSFSIEFKDYGTDLDASLVQRWIARHRLEKTDPSADRSTVNKPIVFHVDRGAPEPVRSALLDGARWWAQAFEEAGFIDAYRVELLPEHAHPLDVRYHVIEWVHRATRGWSYGGGIVDPRTGEILKGHVRLGSLRVRQDRLLFEGLAGTARTGSGDADDPVQLALARIRQLAAHEVGHALGLSHNFAASTYADRASVMDYPAPLIDFDRNGELDFSRAYAIGAGAWDRHAVQYAYAQFPEGVDQDAALENLVREGLDRGLLFLTDPVARPAGAADPRANLWDNGRDAVEELAHVLRVRRHALDRFGTRNIRPGVPLAHLQEVLAPLYFHHRYQLDAALKVIGGMQSDYAVLGDGQSPTRQISAQRQHDALDAVLALLSPAELDLPDEVLAQLAPRPHDEPANREMFASATSPAFDIQGAAATVMNAVFDGLLQPERLGRLHEFRRRDPSVPGVAEVLGRVEGSLFDLRDPDLDSRAGEITRLGQSLWVQRLITAAGDTGLRPALRAQIESALRKIDRRLQEQSDRMRTHPAYLISSIRRFLDRDAGASTADWSPAAPPPGSPIGQAAPDLGACSRHQ